MGAWIETVYTMRVKDLKPVAPLWERGLKQPVLLFVYRWILRRSLMGAWIETGIMRNVLAYNRVAPLWERGLKLVCQ